MVIFFITFIVLVIVLVHHKTEILSALDVIVKPLGKFNERVITFIRRERQKRQNFDSNPYSGSTRGIEGFEQERKQFGYRKRPSRFSLPQSLRSSVAFLHKKTKPSDDSLSKIKQVFKTTVQPIFVETG